MTLTNADLDRLDALAEAATKGPWHYDDGITDEIDGVPERGKPPLVEDMRARWIASTDGMVGEDGFTQEEADANGRLVAAARDAVPALTSEVRRLRGGGGACRADPADGIVEELRTRVVELEAALSARAKDNGNLQIACDKLWRELGDAHRNLVEIRGAHEALVAEVRRLRAEASRGWDGCPGCAGELAGLVDRLCGSCRKQTAEAFGCGAQGRRPRCPSCESVAPPTVAIGARLRDLTVAQLDALPVGARFEDPSDEREEMRPAWAFTRASDGCWYAPDATTEYPSAEMLETWCDSDDNYRLAYLPESR